MVENAFFFRKRSKRKIERIKFAILSKNLYLY